MRHPHLRSSAPWRVRQSVVVPCLIACWWGAAACSSGLVAPDALPTDGPVGPTSASVRPVAPTVATSPPTSPPTIALAIVPGQPTTTAPVSSPLASGVASTSVLSVDGPWTRVATAPGVTTPGLFYALLPQVWVYLPVVEDLPNGVLWTLRDDTVPIIEGYLRAEATRRRAGANVVLRPQVLGDDRTDTGALVADCVWSVGPVPTRTGWGASLELREGEWSVVSSGPREDACWFA